ncbi:hypothetical protein [Streptococcus pseudopneumoniae]|uniref:hypothetical protein n=1 Tax=Streptococcus pseudopneumoniae TaxID=257758 RepID=UPI000E71B1AE|nr:hypothetical protein [Streptococcus pseudopneumoniae]RJP11183.1 hypothetical protein C5O71_03155 [Streptococcus pseudopneumoniae]
MKKYLLFLLILPFIFLTACQYNKKQITEINKENLPIKEGYKEITEQIYLSDQIDTSYKEELPFWDSKKGDKNTLVTAIQNFMGSDSEISEIIADKNPLTRLQKGKTRADITVNKTGSWIHLTSDQISDLSSVFHNLRLDAIENNLNLTDFKEELPFSKEDGVNKVKQFLNTLQLGFDDYDYLIYAISKETLLEYLPTYERNAKELKGTKIDKNNLTDMCYVTVFPKLSSKRVIDGETQLGSSGEISFIHGPDLNFIITQAGIQGIDLSGVILPTQKIDKMATLSVQKGLDVLKEKYENLILDSPIYIESFTIEYIPIPTQEKELYGGNLYRPFLIFTIKEKDRIDKAVIDPTNWKEVS